MSTGTSCTTARCLAFERLRENGMKVRRPERSFATPDHYMPTNTRNVADIADPQQRLLVTSMRENGAATGVTVFDIGDKRQGIVHVVGPEQGITLPGLTLVCGDSHTSTHGALGASPSASARRRSRTSWRRSTLWQRKPKAMRVTVDGELGFGITGKDVILAIIAKIGAAGATGHVIEYAGSAIRALSIEGRLTLCNMSIEGGAAPA